MSNSPSVSLQTDQLIACHDCDLLHERRALAEGAVAKCSRCGATLYAEKRNSLERTLMLSLTSLILFIPANVYSFMTFELHGRVNENRIITGVRELHAGGLYTLALLVGFTSILAPLVKILLLLYISVPLRLNRTPWMLARAFTLYEGLAEWGMLNIYVIGAFVAVSKLFDFGSLSLDIGFYAFIALMLVAIAADNSLDPRIVWARLKAEKALTGK